MLHKNLTTLLNGFIPRMQVSNNRTILHLLKKSIVHSNFIQSVNYTAAEVLNRQILLRYIEESGLDLNQVPGKSISIRSRTSDIHLINSKVAKEFALLIKDDLLKNTTHVIEMNPGFGFLTLELLKSGVPFIHMYEKEPQFQETLNNLCNKYPEKLSLTTANLYDLSRLMHFSHFLYNIENNVFELLDNVQQRSWEEESCMQIIGATCKSSFLNHLIFSTMFQTCFMMYGRPTFYLAIPPSIWHRLTRTRHLLKPNRVMFETMFNYTMFGSIDRKAFIPWQKYKEVKNNCKETLKNIFHTKDPYLLYVVKVEGKPNLFTTFNGRTNLIYFWHFVRHNLQKPSSRVIPTLENIIPGCGLRLILKNYNIFTQFLDLDVNQFLDLFLELRSWPEFENSGFTSAANDISSQYRTYLQKE